MRLENPVQPGGVGPGEHAIDRIPAAGGREVAEKRKERVVMKFLMLLIAWCVLLVLCWPLALLLVVLAPLVWLVCLPFRVLGVAVEGLLALIRAVFLLPARLLGHKS